MAVSAPGQGHETNGVSRDVSKDLIALESIHSSKETVDDDPFSSTSPIESNPFKQRHDDDDDVMGGYTMNDLLNGYVVDEETLSAVDECLLVISSKWDVSDILSKDVTDCERLLSANCNKAHSVILSSIIDQPNVLYETLLRLSRKIMAISLVIDNQKMIFVPV